MPPAPLHPCGAPGCPEYRPCPVHGRRPRATRPDRDRQYGRPYRRARRAKLQRQPWCEDCLAMTPPRRRLAVETHHLAPTRATGVGGAHDPANLRSLCIDCHDRRDRSGPR